MLTRLRNVFLRITRTGIQATTVALVLVGFSPAAAAHQTERLTVNDRIARIRAVAREQTQVTVELPEEPAGETQLAQWYNWGNWGNWNNWNNWYNWPNWGNWGNWGNG